MGAGHSGRHRPAARTGRHRRPDRRVHALAQPGAAGPGGRRPVRPGRTRPGTRRRGPAPCAYLRSRRAGRRRWPNRPINFRAVRCHPPADLGVSHITVAELAETTEVRDERSDACVYAALAPELIRFASSLVGPAMRPTCCPPRWSGPCRRPGGRRWPTAAPTSTRPCSARRARGAAEARSDPAGKPACCCPTAGSCPAFVPTWPQAVARLSVRQRAVVVLTYWADLDPAAIAVMLDVSEGSVRRHLARARAHLRKVLDA